MRVLITTWGWPSHFFPLAPVGWALAAAGHTVRVASQPAMVEAIVTAGLPAVPVGQHLDFADVFSGQVDRVAPRHGGAGARSGIAPVVTPDGGVVRFADAMLADLMAFGRSFRPDLVVYEPLNLAGAIAAEALGVPGVRLLWGPDSSTELALDEDLIISPRAARYGADRVNLAGALTLDPCPPLMQVPLDGPSQALRFVPYNGRAVLPGWLVAEPTRPRVCVTWGTMMAGLGLVDLIGVHRVVAALAELDIEVVLALDAAHQVGELPANARLADAPLALHLLLATCAAVVHQGGAGTTMTALAAGVPQLVLPQVSDQHFNAARLARTGAGTFLSTEDATDRAIRARMAELIGHERWRGSADQMRRHNESRPSPAEVVAVLERLAS